MLEGAKSFLRSFFVTVAWLVALVVVWQIFDIHLSKGAAIAVGIFLGVVSSRVSTWLEKKQANKRVHADGGSDTVFTLCTHGKLASDCEKHSSDARRR